MVAMPREARQISKTGIYHVMWRGAAGQDIFHDDADRIKYLDILLKYKNNTNIEIYGWCLMSNHVHVLLREGYETLSATMKRIGISYVAYYNWKYQVRGHLFQDRFKSEKVETIPYLMTVIRYIHQNPVKAGLIEGVANWKWSSCGGYYGGRVYPQGLLNDDFILKYFSENLEISRKYFREFNERPNQDACLDEPVYKRRCTDEEARIEIQKILREIQIPQVKTLPREHRNELLREIKRIDGLSLRQVARIIGVSASLVSKV